MTPGSDPSRLPPLPIRPRPASGETAGSYVRRLATANHLRPSYLHSILRAPFPVGGISPERLAALSGRSAHALKHALDGLGSRTASPSAIVFFASLIDTMIAADPGISAMQIWRRLTDDHDANVGYPGVLHYCRRHRPCTGED